MGHEGQKTGGFHLQARLLPGLGEEARRLMWTWLLNQMMHCLAVILQDGRAYELRAQFEELPPEADGGLRVDFSLVLLNAVDAEEGEWVKGMPVAVPEEDYFHRLPVESGRLVFQRGLFGWRRVE